MPLERLTQVDELGDNATHFFKSGNFVRNSENDKLGQMKDLLPSNGPKGTRVEYDIWYDMGDKENVHGYVYTDAMSKFIYLRVAGSHFAHKNIEDACKSEITEEGERIFNDIAQNSLDKYRLRKARTKYDFVIFLPGTNIIDEAVDWGKVRRAVDQGAKLKCHPITANAAVTKLKADFGEDVIIDKRISGHQLLEEASIVGCCPNSEMGIIALAKGKKVYLFGAGRNYTYSAIYNTIFKDGNKKQDMLKRLLSAKDSGLVSSLADNPQEYIDGFFNKWKDYPHVAPKNSDS